MSKQFIPNGERYLVKQEAVVHKVGGLYIPETSAEAPAEGTIIRVGNFIGSEFGNNFSAGTKVSFGTYAGIKVKLDENEYLILTQEEILGEIKED